MSRKPTPLAIREREGTMRSRHKRKAEKAPKTELVLLQDIEGMSESAQQHWPRFRAMLEAINVTTVSDIGAVERMCECYAEIREYQELLAEEGKFYWSETKTGSIMRQHPALSALQDADRRFRAYLTDFGLTPASRAKVQSLGGNEDDDPLEEFGV